MKKLLSLILAALTALSLLASCAVGESDASYGAVSAAGSSSAGAAESVEWLNERLGRDYAGEVTLSIGADADVDFSDFPDGGYVIRTIGDETAISASSAYDLDLAVRDFAKNYAGAGDVYVTEGEGYRVKSMSIDGVDISEWKIVVETQAIEGHTENPAFAGTELQAYIKKACGVKLPIEVRAGTSASGGKGGVDAGRVIRIVQAPKDDALGKEGLHIYFENGDLILRGGYKRGTMYAVYEFLEKYVGWRFFGLDDMTFVYKTEKLEIAGDINCETSPAFSMRQQRTTISGYPTTAPKISANTGYPSLAALFRNNVSSANSSAAYGYLEYTRGTIHTFAAQLAELYSGDNPCYTDEFLIEELGYALEREAMAMLNTYKHDQGMPVISVGPNDTPAYCTCKNCINAIKDGGGAVSAAFLGFIIPAIEYATDIYPDATFLTIAYQNTVKPPNNIERLPDNLYMVYCTNHMCMKHSMLNYEGCADLTTCAEAREHIEGWAKMTDHLGAWMYYSNFCNTLVPSSTFNSMRENLQFYEQVGLDIVSFETYNYGFGFDDLRNYLMSKLFWNPNISEEEMNAMAAEYMAAYYGDGWENIYEYWLFLEKSAQNSGRCFPNLGSSELRADDGYAHPWYSQLDYLSGYKMILSLFDDARAKANSAEIEARIDFLEVHVHYFYLCSAYDTKYVGGNAEERAEYEELYLYYCGLLTYYGKTPDKVSAYLVNTLAPGFKPSFTAEDLKYNPSICIW